MFIVVFVLLLCSCHQQLQVHRSVQVSECTKDTETDALSYAHEKCLRKHLQENPTGELIGIFAHHSPPLRSYLSLRAAAITGQNQSLEKCVHYLPAKYCLLLDARRQEDLGESQKAHQIYALLKKDRVLQGVALTGMVRTETDVTHIDELAFSKPHPDLEPALCTQLIRQAPTHALPSVLKQCSVDSATITIARSRREWSFGLRNDSIRRLEAHLHRDPLLHQIRIELVERLLNLDAHRSALDHMEVLNSYQTLPNRYSMKRLLLLIKTGVVDDTGTIEKMSSQPFSSHQKLLLALALAARKGRCDEIATTLSKIHFEPNIDFPPQIEGIETTLTGTSCFGSMESVLLRWVERSKKEPKAWVKLIEYYLKSEQREMARRLLDSILNEFPDDAHLCYLAARLNGESGRIELAEELILRARSQKPNDLNFINFEVELYLKTGRLEKASQQLERAVNLHPDHLENVRQLALIRLMIDDFIGARNLLSWLCALRPFDAHLQLQYATTLARLSDTSVAKEALVDITRQKADFGDAWALLAITHASLGESEKAEAAFKTALQLDSAHRHLRLAFGRFLESLDRPADAQQQYERLLARYPQDEDALLAMHHLGVDVGQQTYGYNHALVAYGDLNLPDILQVNSLDDEAVILKDVRLVEVLENGDLVVDIHRDIFIRKSTAISQFSSVEIPYDHNFEPTLRYGAVMTPDGEEILLQPSDLTHLNPNAESAMFGDARLLRLKFPSLEPGSIISYQIQTRLPLKPTSRVWWDSYVLGNEVFTLASQYTLSVPHGERFRVNEEGLPKGTTVSSDTHVKRTWQIKNIPSFKVLTQANLAVPTIFLSSFNDWAEVDRWYTSVFSPTTSLGESLKKQASIIRKNKTTWLEKVSAVIELVETEVAYEGVEYGVGAYRPRPAESTWRRRRGDCKDMVAIMVGLFKELDIPSHPVLIRPRDSGPFNAAYPSPSQFSHVILALRDPSGTLRWIDPTAKMGTLDALPSLLRGAKALVINGSGGQIVQIPEQSPTRSTVSQRTSITIDYRPVMPIRSELTLSGDSAGWARTYIQAQQDIGQSRHLYAPGLLLGQNILPEKVTVNEQTRPAKPISLLAIGHQARETSADGLLIFNGILDPTDSGFIAQLNNADHTNPPRQFTKEIEFIFSEPHQLMGRINSLGLQGPISIRVKHHQDGLTHLIKVHLEIDQKAILKADQSTFVRHLQVAQMILETQLRFKRIQ